MRDPGWTSIAQRVDAWIRFAWPVELRRMRAATAGEIVVPPAVPGADEIEQATRPLRWLVERCAAGVTLTQSGYLPPALVTEAADAFGWWPFDGKPRTEADVHQLQLLRDTARRSRLTWRRGRRLAATQAGRRLLDDPVGLWRAIALGVGGSAQFSRTVSELVALRLLDGPPAESVEVAAVAVPILMGQDWLRGRRPISEDEVRWSVHEPLRYWRLFGLLDEPRLDRSRGLDAPWTISFTRVGRLAALTFLHDLATGGDAH